MAKVKSKDIRERINEYLKQLQYFKEKIQNEQSEESVKEAIDYIHDEGLGKLIENEQGENPASALKNLRKDDLGCVNLDAIVGIISFLIMLFTMIKKQLKKLHYIARWKPAEEIPDYTYHVSESNNLYENFVESLKRTHGVREQPKKKGKVKKEIGLVFGVIQSNHELVIHGLLPIKNLLAPAVRRSINDSEFIEALTELNYELISDKLREELVINTLRIILDKFFFESNDVLFRKKILQSLFSYEGTESYSNPFKAWLFKKESSPEKRRKFLYRKFLGLYLFEEGVLDHVVITKDILKKLRELHMLPKIPQNVRNQFNIKDEEDFLKIIGLNELPRFLFLNSTQFNQVSTLFESFEPVLESRTWQAPPILLCFDNKVKHNCMCIGKNDLFGFQRIRHIKHKRNPTRRQPIKRVLNAYPALLPPVTYATPSK